MPFRKKKKKKKYTFSLVLISGIPKYEMMMSLSQTPAAFKHLQIHTGSMKNGTGHATPVTGPLWLDNEDYTANAQ